MTTTTPTAVHPFEPFRQRAADALFTAIPDHLDRLGWDAGRLARLQTDRLRTLVSHAQDHSLFHASRLAGVDATTLELSDLAQLPVMDKPTMMECFDDVVTDRRLHRADLEWIVEHTGDDPMPALGEYVVLTSGGSSGTRGIFVMDAAALAEFSAYSIRQGIAAQLAEGGPAPEGFDSVMIAAGSPIHATAVGPRLGEGDVMRMTRVPATLPFEEIVERVRAIDPEMIMGYPSVLAQLATEQAAGRLGLRLRALTTSSETLTTAVRAQLETAFGVGVVDLFGSSEGLIGVSEPGDTVVSFASDGCIVEPVDEHDQPVPVGEPSAAVLITNLYNLVQPLIRYRVDDRFVQAPPSPRHGHFRAEIDGRTSESLRWGEVVVHPLAVTNELLQTPAIVDYVVRQTSAGVAIEVVAVAPVDLASVAAAIQRDLGAAGLVDAEVVITCIDEVPRHAQTGKAKRIVPLGG